MDGRACPESQQEKQLLGKMNSGLAMWSGSTRGMPVCDLEGRGHREAGGAHRDTATMGRASAGLSVPHGPGLPAGVRRWARAPRMTHALCDLGWSEVPETSETVGPVLGCPCCPRKILEDLAKNASAKAWPPQATVLRTEGGLGPRALVPGQELWRRSSSPEEPRNGSPGN